jgi:hypothetical protein
MRVKPWPCSRQGWADHYAQQFNKTGSEQAVILAMWYQMLALAFGD